VSLLDTVQRLQRIHEPPYAEPHVRWCGRAAEVTQPPTRSAGLYFFCGLGATPVGRRVTAFAEVTGGAGRHIEFRVWAMDQAEEIGAGTHARVVIELARFSERLAAKFTNKGD